MNGVEILSSETIYNSILPDWVLALATVSFVICFFATLIATINDHYITAFVFAVLFIGALLTVGLGSTIENKNSPHHIEYKVVIDDSVSMNEFLDKYEILDQEGKIYTVRERE